MSVFPFTLVRRAAPPDSVESGGTSPATPWLVLTGFAMVVTVSAATALFALHYPLTAVLSLVGGAAGVAMTTVGYVYQVIAGRGAK